MATMSYQGPLPFPSATFPRSLPWPTVPMTAHGPALGASAAVISLRDTVLPPGTQSTAYSQTVTVTGSTGPYTFAITSGSLPAGLSLNSSTGVISGTPTGTGSSSFTIRATDPVSNTGSQAFTLVIAAPSSGGGNFGFVF